MMKRRTKAERLRRIQLELAIAAAFAEQQTAPVVVRAAPPAEEIAVQGQRVRVQSDDATGRTRMATSAAFFDTPAAETIAHLATAAVFAERERQRIGPVHHTQRTARSTTTRRARAAAHWSQEWLQAAHPTESHLGAQRLALAARKLCLLNKPEMTDAKRAEITEYRAKQFLKNQSHR